MFIVELLKYFQGFFHVFLFLSLLFFCLKLLSELNLLVHFELEWDFLIFCRVGLELLVGGVVRNLFLLK